MSVEDKSTVTITIDGRLSGHCLTIPGRMPGLNEYTTANREHRQSGASMKHQHQATVLWSIKTQLRGVKFTRPVFLVFTFYEKDRRRDHDNVSSFARKVIQDALVKSGVLEDDGWNHVTGYLDLFEVDKKNPRITVQFIEQEVPERCKKQRKTNSAK